MRTLGLDLGVKTLGIAISDVNNELSLPVKVIDFPREDYEYLIPELTKIITEKKITDVVLGYPKNMDNTEGFASKRSQNFKVMLEKLNVKVHLVDERLSTTEALNILKETGNKNLKQKNIVDAIAASIILERYLKGRKDE